MRTSLGHQGVPGARPAAGGCAQSAAGQRTVMCLPCDGGQPETAGPAPPVLPPVAPMAATRVTRLPTGPGWVYEPKLDGFIN
jgi:ATP-dependent DNA ligase